MRGVASDPGARLPRWLQGVFPASDVGPPTAEFIHGQPGDVPYRSFSTEEVATVTARIVCGTCNNGWMATLEGQARPLLTQMGGGTPADLDMAQQILVAAWAVKTAMTAEMTLEMALTPSYEFDQESRGTVATGVRPPVNVPVNLAAYSGTQGPLEFVKAVGRLTRDGRDPMDVVLYTIKLGCLILQVAAFPTGTAVGLSDAPAPGQFHIPVFPPVPTAHWPPHSHLDDARMARFRAGLPLT